MTLSVRRRSSEAMPARRGLFAEFGSVAPLSDVAETDDAYLVKVDLPGIKLRDVDVSVAGRRLTVAAERRERAGILWRRTRRVRRFRYEIWLPGEVDGDGIDAHLERGVLTLRVPKAAGDRPHRIAVSAT
jgi:HSP20 family protein